MREVQIESLALSSVCSLQLIEAFSRFGGFGAERITPQDFSPGGAVVVKSLRYRVKSEADALPVVPVEPIEVHEVGKLRRSTCNHLVVIQPARCISRKLGGSLLGRFSI